MGETIETALVFCLVFTMIVFFITAPVEVCRENKTQYEDACEELAFHMENDKIADSSDIDGVSVNDISQERLNTLLSDVSDMIRIIGTEAV